MATANAMFTITDVGDLNGRNLLQRSFFTKDPWTGPTYNAVGDGFGIYHDRKCLPVNPRSLYFNTTKGTTNIFPDLIFEEGVQYTLSGNWAQFRTDDKYTQMVVRIYHTDGTRVELFQPKENNVWKSFKCTSTAGKTVNKITVSYNTEGITYIENFKLEVGAAATEWTPAPEDANDTYITANYAKTEVNGLEVGGRNILKHSEQVHSIIRSYGSSVINTESNITVDEWSTNSGVRYYGNAGTSVIFGLIGGSAYYIAQKDFHYLDRPYTLSAYVKNLSETSRLRFKVNGTLLAEAVEIAPLEQKRVVYVYSKPSTASAVQLTLYVDTAGDPFDFVLWHPQIEYGNRATDWTPAPEDVEESINSKNSVYYQSTTPTAHKVGDTWFDTANDYKIRRWNGSTWAAAELGNQAIGNLNASHINSGTLTAVHIEAGKAQDIAGTINVYDEDDDIKVRLDKDGLMATKGIVGGWNIGENTLESDHVSGVDESGVEHTGKSILDVEGGLEIVGSSTTKYTPDIYQRDWEHPSVSLWGESHIGPRSISSEYLVANDKSIAKGGFWIPGRNISAWYTLTPRKQIANTGIYFTLYTKGDLSLFWLILDGKTPEWTAGVKNNVATSLVDYVDSPTAHFINSVQRSQVAPPYIIWLINGHGVGTAGGRGGVCNNYGQEIQPYINTDGYINIYRATTSTGVAPITANVFWAHIDYPYTES